MTVTAAAFGDVTSRDRPPFPVRRDGAPILRHLLCGTAAIATAGGAVAVLTLAVGWSLSASLPKRDSDLARTNFGLRHIALAPPDPDMPTRPGPANIVIVVPEAAARPAQLAEASPPPAAALVEMPVRKDELPLPPPLPPVLARSPAAERLIASAPPLPPPAPESRAVARRADNAPAPAALPDNRTAIYDITARVVYLPNGKTLEAHSGLGQWRDDPRHVGLKMRGPTPPNTYKLSLRESLFHGVRAIRLTPVDEGKMFGRDGMLAHTYMLGPDGDSNGCVSFKNYPAFLEAYLRGDIDRLIVVPHDGAALARAKGNRTVRYAANEH
jgi:hypothetical protein